MKPSCLQGFPPILQAALSLGWLRHSDFPYSFTLAAYRGALRAVRTSPSRVSQVIRARDGWARRVPPRQTGTDLCSRREPRLSRVR